MKFGLRTPSLKRRLSARLSWKRYVRHSMGIKMPRGTGFLTNPKKALYNKVYNKTSISVDKLPNLFKTSKKVNTTSHTHGSQKSASGGLWISLIIFLVLSAIHPIIGLAFVAFKLLYKPKGSVTNSISEKGSTVSSTNLVSQFYIPEPTKSLLWITDEDPAKIESPMTIKLSINSASGEVGVTEEHNLYSEPSLIWVKLPLEPNTELDEKPMYYPSYSGLSPKNRYQYINWLKNIELQTNLSYVFLYFYGLERHLLIGNYDGAVEEVKRLIKFHDTGSFKSYALRSLIAASAYRKKPEIINALPGVLDEVSNVSLMLRKIANKPLSAKEIIQMASLVGFTNKRYIRKYPDIFENTLSKNLDLYTKEYGDPLLSINLENITKSQEILFANVSIPENIRTMPVYNILSDITFKNELFMLLTNTHGEVKSMKITDSVEE